VPLGCLGVVCWTWVSGDVASSLVECVPLPYVGAVGLHHLAAVPGCVVHRPSGPSSMNQIRLSMTYP
jgi:hypothetical protein